MSAQKTFSETFPILTAYLLTTSISFAGINGYCSYRDDRRSRRMYSLRYLSFFTGAVEGALFGPIKPFLCVLDLIDDHFNPPKKT